MRVVTLNNEALEEHARRLADMVAADGGLYDVIIGVRRGGSIVCDAFCRHFPKSCYGFRADVSLQRPSTKKKGGRVGTLLKRLPYRMLNLMRMAESRLLELKNRHSALQSVRESVHMVELPDSLRSLLKEKDTPEILIIDDAIDSGNTLSAIIRSLKEMNPKLQTKAAVITETTPSPCLRADYKIYRDRTLIRFPWSNDYKKPKGLHS